MEQCRALGGYYGIFDMLYMSGCGRVMLALSFEPSEAGEGDAKDKKDNIENDLDRNFDVCIGSFCIWAKWTRIHILGT
ncbi:MAG: hypothetical protein IJF27_08760 [Oscillospiraceae bacterium]|nr:hypothetical protein [Oscillospiraceae bacterium]